jgi:putative colanic acid biosynthesis acetyltransferase WcaF
VAIIEGNDPYRQASFSLRNRLGRGLWGIVWLLLFRLSPRPLHPWRAFLLKVFGAKIGTNCHVYPGVKIWAPWNIRLGDHVGIADGVILYSMACIDIGDYAVISQGAHLCAGSHDFNSANFQLIAAPIAVGARTWLCAESFVGPGVSIAEGSVVGARGVVVKPIADEWCVWGGVPVKKIGERDKATVLR